MRTAMLLATGVLLLTACREDRRAAGVYELDAGASITSYLQELNKRSASEQAAQRGTVELLRDKLRAVLKLTTEGRATVSNWVAGKSVELAGTWHQKGEQLTLTLRAGTDAEKDFPGRTAGPMVFLTMPVGSMPLELVFRPRQ